MSEHLTDEQKAFGLCFFVQNPTLADFVMASAELDLAMPNWLPSDRPNAIRSERLVHCLRGMSDDAAMERVLLAQQSQALRSGNSNVA